MPTDANHPATVTQARRGRKYSHDPDTVPVLLSFWQELDFGGDTGTVRIRVRPLVNPTGGESPEVAAIAVEDADTPFTLEFIGQDGTVLHGLVERVDAGPFTGTGRQVRDRLDMTAQSVVRMVPRRYRIGAVPPRVPDPTVVTVPSMQVDVRCQRADALPVKASRKVIGFELQWTFSVWTPNGEALTGMVHGVDMTSFTATRDRFAQRLRRWEDAVTSSGGRPLNDPVSMVMTRGRRCEYQIPPGTPENPVKPGEVAQEKSCGKVLDRRAKGRFCTRHREKQAGQFEVGHTRYPRAAEIMKRVTQVKAAGRQRPGAASFLDQLFGSLDRDYAQIRALVPALFEGRVRKETRLELEAILSKIGDEQQLRRSELMAEWVQEMLEDGEATGDSGAPGSAPRVSPGGTARQQ